jgi:hypothetical protein
MKKLFALIATSVALSASPASAIVGGPWGGNNFNLTSSGVYQATMYIPNGLGMARFSDDTSAQFSAINQSVIFFRGAVYVGSCFGTVDWANGKVNAVTNGDTINNFTDSGAARSIDIANTYFIADITEEAPIMRFSGRGQANFFGALDTFDSERITTTTIIEGDTEIEIEGLVTSEGGENPLPLSIGEPFNIYVFGAQIGF